MNKATEFWTSSREDLKDLAEMYNRNVEIVHPGFVASNRLSPWSYYGLWNTTSVAYYEYRGPRI